MTAWNLKKVESTNLRLHGICVVGRLPKDTNDLGKRFPFVGKIGTCFVVGRDFVAFALVLVSTRIMHALSGAELRGRHAGHCTEGAGEGAVVGEAALQRDLGNGTVRLTQES